MCSHGLQHGDQASHIYIEVVSRPRNAFCYRLEAGEMHHGLERRALHQIVDCSPVADIRLDDTGSGASCCLADTVCNVPPRVGEIVEDDDVMAVLEQFGCTMRADIPCATGQKHGSNGHLTDIFIAGSKSPPLSSQFLKALGGTKDRLGEVTGTTKEMADTLDDNAWKALKDVMRALAGPFMTALEDVRDDIIDVSKAITGWIKENPELAGTLAKIAIMLTTLIAACGAFTIMMSSLLGPIVTVRLGLAMLGVKTTGIGGRIYALTSKILPALGKGILMIGRTLAVAGRLLLTNPIGLAITALAGAAEAADRHRAVRARRARRRLHRDEASAGVRVAIS